MDTIIFLGVTVLLGIPVILLRRYSHRSNPCPRDSYGYQIPKMGGGVTIFGSNSRPDAISHASKTIERVTEVK